LRSSAPLKRSTDAIRASSILHSPSFSVQAHTSIVIPASNRSGSALVAPRLDMASASVARVTSRDAVLKLAKESRFIHEISKKRQ
jgi:hypothetical protein